MTAGDNIRLPDTWLGKTLHPVWRSKGMVRQLQRDHVDLYHGLSHELPIGLHRAGIPSVVSMHDLIFMRFPDLYPATDRLFYAKKYRRAAMMADRVVAISGQTREDLETYFKIPARQVQVIGQSCDAAFEQLSFRAQGDKTSLPLPTGLNIPDSDYIISVGSLSPRKNWHVLLEALFLLKKQGFDAPLVAVGTGKGAYVDGLHRQAKALDLKVYWLDQHVSTRDLALLYRRAAVMVYPSIFEGFGIPILEAMTIGIPVVTTRGGCFEEVGGDAALYADSNHPNEFAAQIARAFEADVRSGLSLKMPAQIEKFAPQKICAEWMALYQDLKK